MSVRKAKNKTLSEKVAESLSHDLDGSEYDSENESAPKVIQFDEEDYNFEGDQVNKSFSQIRKLNAKLLSEQSSKYSGEIASRRNVDSSDDDFDVNDSGVTEDDDQASSVSESEQQNSDSESCEDSDSDNGIEEDDELPKGNLISAKNYKLETEKGLCVQNQLAVWEKLLEIRIHSQKILNKANSLPCPNDLATLSSDKKYKLSAQEAKRNVELLLEKLIETQANLASQFSEIKKLGISGRKRSHHKSNEDEDSSSSKKFALSIQSNFESFRPYRNSVLLKWDDRTKLLAPSGATKRKHVAEEFDIVSKVDNVLIKREDHILKSQKVKGNYTLYRDIKSKAVEKLDSNGEVSSPHIYDDTDFYHSQLRELIEFKSNVSSNTYDVTTQFAELQKLRQKMKKTVDTRASKGRKIRYVVHHKLVNFMAPNNTTEWTEESKNELYRSLFVT